MSIIEQSPTRVEVLAPNRTLRRVHLVGVCGSGMKPIAQALLTIGVEVSGSDPDAEKGAALKRLGARLYSEHRAEQIHDQDVVVYSSAISSGNPELKEAQRLGIPLVHRSEMLGWFLSRQESVLVAGTHGKTTTTAMLTLLLEAQGAEPWGFVGGTVDRFGGNLRIGKGRLAVAEADESDGTFLNLPRRHAIVTNIEPEHLNFWGTEERMFAGFVDFVEAIPAAGNLVLCHDDPGCRRLHQSTSKNVTSYSLDDAEADFHALNVNLSGTGSSFDLIQRGVRRGRIHIGVPGRQNVANGMAAFAMALKLGADFQVIQDALAEFHGVDRRFTKREAPGGFLVVDDYGHHPTEIAATMAAARLLADERGGRLLAVLQPHRYTRTESFFNLFGPAVVQADDVIVTEIYAAGEQGIEGVSGASLAMRMTQQIERPVRFVADFSDVKKQILETIKERDIVLLLGAGSITKLAPALAQPVGTTAPAH
jgi:UDP-N-acetylmuramate--alanine ligase